MEITVEFKNHDTNVIERRSFSRGYLSKFVDPKKMYAVPYTIMQDGKLNSNPNYLRGEDLTENQIAILFANQLL